MKEWTFQLRYRCIRGMERMLPIGVFYALILSLGWVRTGLRLFRGLPPALPLPACLRVKTSLRSIRQWRVYFYVRQTLAYFPERLIAPRWMARCRFTGLEELRRAKAAGRPVILAFTHFSAYQLIGYWLRAAGIPVATLIATQSGTRGPLRLMSDKNSLFPGQPTVLHRELRQVNDFVAGGNTLLVAVDVPAGKLVDVPAGDGTWFKMAIGAARLAAYHDAELFACTIRAVGPWRYHLDISPAVPRETLAGEAGLARAGKELLDRILPHLQEDPRQCSKMLLDAFVKKPNVAASASHPDEPIAA